MRWVGGIREGKHLPGVRRRNHHVSFESSHKMVARVFFPKWTFIILLQSVSGWQNWRIKEIFWNWVIEPFYRLAACDLRKIWKQRLQWTLGNNWCTGESVQTNVYRRLFTVEKCTNGKCTKIAQRRDLWGIAWQMISQRPLRGKGGQQKKRREWLWRRKPPPPLLKESKRWRLHFQLSTSCVCLLTNSQKEANWHRSH